ncbi:MAG: thermonuclease family protein [Rhodospirillaceae bacterium]|nr:thermonuclease family protein [Rhodospirillaceae bacterium]
MLLLMTAGTAQASSLSGIAVEVRDGRTLVLSDGTGIRLFGIQTPARTQMCQLHAACKPCGEESREALRKLSVGELTCERWGKSLGYTVARCSANGEDLSLKMLASGQAMLFRRYLRRGESLPISYLIAEARARARQLGIWADGLVRPWSWRHAGARLACEEPPESDTSR